MSWPRLIVFVRHAESEGNIRTPDERALLTIPNHAFPLSPYGVEQAEKTGAYLRARFGAFDTYFASYYTRARETLRYIYPSITPRLDARLAEAQRGYWNNVTAEQVSTLFPHEEIRKKQEGLYHYRPLGGENWPDVELRIHSFLDMLRRDFVGQRILVVTHGNWLLLLQKILHDTSPEDVVERYKKESVVPNAAVLVYESARRWPWSKQNIVFKEQVVPWRLP